jgi:cellulose synthase/poly-beta-1,6-N-acetylglucosamine synthase-like glycosyltransferase
MTLMALLFLLLQAVVGAGLIYHYILLIAGGRPRRSAADGATPESSLRFAVAVPAHNEEIVIGETVARLCLMDYPPDRFDVHVVADHCTDATTEVARLSGAIVHERFEGPRGRKGYALAWLLTRLLGSAKDYDAVVVFDADSRVAPDFLRLMNAALAGGVQVVQGRHVVANPQASVFSALADADMRLNNRMRNQAKENLGLSARLMGDGMCFHRLALEQHPSGAHSLTEDREYGIHLVSCGVRVRYLPEAVSAGEAVVRWSDATDQRLRWYGGVFALQKHYLSPLLASAWRDRRLDAFDLALELLLPSFSTQSALAVGLVVLQVLLGRYQSPFSLGTSILLAISAFLLPFWGLLAERAPWYSFRALIYGPAYAAWRLWLGLLVRLRRGRVPWIRTRRAEEEGTGT